MTNKEAIEILKNYHNGYFGYKIDDVHKAHNLAIKALEERLTGEWIEFKGGYYKCDKCGEVERAKKNFCSRCGNDMRGKENEQTTD